MITGHPPDLRLKNHSRSFEDENITSQPFDHQWLGPGTKHLRVVFEDFHAPLISFKPHDEGPRSKSPGWKRLRPLPEMTSDHLQKLGYKSEKALVNVGPIRRSRLQQAAIHEEPPAIRSWPSLAPRIGASHWADNRLRPIYHPASGPPGSAKYRKVRKSRRLLRESQKKDWPLGIEKDRRWKWVWTPSGVSSQEATSTARQHLISGPEAKAEKTGNRPKPRLAERLDSAARRTCRVNQEFKWKFSEILVFTYPLPDRRF